MICLDEAERLIRAAARPLGVETVALKDARNRTLAVSLVATRCAPETAVSAMDGYAVRTADLDQGALRVVGESRAGGGYGGDLPPGGAVRIFTGAPAPRGADRVIMQEDARVRDGLVTLVSPCTTKTHIRPPGSDFATGDVLAPAGLRLTPQALVAAAAANRAAVEVWRRPRVAILSTGDELAAPGEAAPGQIPESVSLGAAAIVEQWGGSVVRCARLPDKLPLLQDAARKAADEDLIVVTGGASVGDYDFARQMFSDLEIIIPKVAIRPGKPVWMGRSGSAVILGLPGNPTAAMVTARLLLAPLVAGLSGRSPCEALKWRSDVLAVSLPSNGERETFLLGRAAPKGVEVLTRQDSSGQKALAMTSLLVRRPPGAAPAEPGQTIDVLEF
ncbi:MAG: molybdopterin molybdotransferase MoeA [Caulobacteraceae bacterium]